MSSINIEKSAEKGINDLLRHLLGTGKVDAVLAVRMVQSSGAWDLALVTEVENLAELKPLAPVMTVNASQVLSNLSLSGKKIAAVLKPCELRGFVERVKREQGSLENLITISHTCGGVFPLDLVVEGSVDDLLHKYDKVVASGEIPSNIRDTCKACEHFIPMNADITIAAAGECKPGHGCMIYINSDKARKALAECGGQHGNALPDPVSLERLTAARAKEREKLFSSIEKECSGLDGLVNIFGKCVGCHGCSRVCPICYCTLCDFESANFDYNLPYFEEHLARKGALRLPPDTMLFHMGRLTHMSFSCVGCGMCSDVCPVSIPVAAVFSRTGAKTASIFDYVPGRDVAEEIPVMIFKEEEFPELG